MLTNTPPAVHNQFSNHALYSSSGKTKLERTLAPNEVGTTYGLSRPASILQIAEKVVLDSDLGLKNMAISTLSTAKTLDNQLKGRERHKLGLIDAMNHSLIAQDFSVCMEWARIGGFAIIHLPDVGLVDDIELMSSYSLFMKEVGDVAKQLNETLADRKVTAGEALAMKKEAREVVSSLFAFTARLDSLVED